MIVVRRPSEAGQVLGQKMKAFFASLLEVVLGREKANQQAILHDAKTIYQCHLCVACEIQSVPAGDSQ